MARQELDVTWSQLSEQSQRVVQAFVARQAQNTDFSIFNPQSVGDAFVSASAALMSNPAKLLEAQIRLWHDSVALWQNAAWSAAGQETEPLAEPAHSDRRFKDEAWVENPLYDYIKQSYLLVSRWVQGVVTEVEGLDPKDKEKVEFYTRQYLSAVSPSNFAMTNPQIVRKTLDSGGKNLLSGLKHLLDDLEQGEGRLQISMTDQSAFKVGENIAVSPGKVVFQNDLMQLIQYAPSTETCHKRPLLFVPPWINKFYVLDLQPKNSLIKWVVDQGHTLFVISWVNPRKELSHKTFEDYMREGPLAALDVIEAATDERHVNVMGFCIGGILLVATLAYLAAGGDKRVHSATFLATMVDLKDVGEVSVFIDEAQLKALEAHVAEKGYLEGHHMADMFNMMRENDLIWSFVVNNYLMGRDPMRFDLLYWNSDSTRLPAAMLVYYLRKVYLENSLVEPGGLVIGGVPIDVRKISTPCYFLATKDDHIAPWVSSYPATQLFQGPVKFVLGASGHIAGVINPPAAGKYCYWVNDEKPATAAAWFADAKRHEGSWWTDWGRWLARKGGAKVAARTPGDGKLPVLEDAPGTYVLQRASA